MRAPLLVAALLLACAGCTTGPVPTSAAPNGDVTRRDTLAAPDTPANKAPKAGFRDKATDTDPSSPRIQDRGQKVLVPTATGI